MRIASDIIFGQDATMPNSLPQQPIALVVEDEPELQEIYRTVLQAEGWEVRIADNGD